MMRLPVPLFLGVFLSSSWGACAPGLIQQERRAPVATPEQLDRIEDLRLDLEAGEIRARDVLVDPDVQDLRSFAPFMHLMRDHCRTSRLCLVPPEEPGERLVIHGSIVDDEKKPIGGALVYAFHTDARGFYALHASDDERHVRLYGFVRTDAQGKFRLETILPGRYAHEPSIPRHVHFDFRIPGYERARGEGPANLYFDDDAMVDEHRKEILSDGGVISKPRRDEEGVLHSDYEMVFKKEKPSDSDDQ